MEETFSGIIKYVIPGIAFVLGLLIKHYFNLLKNRIPKLRYVINKSFLGASGEDRYIGKVEVLYNNQPVKNLYLCNIYLVNASNKDFKDLEITVWCDTDSTILVSNAAKSNSINILNLTSKYLEEYQNITDSNYTLVSSRRPYHVPVLNREDSVTFSCLVTNPKGAEPNIYLNCEYPGLKIVADFVPPILFWGERQDIGILWGLVISAILIIPTIYYVPSKLFVGIIALILGACVLLPGVLMLKFLRKIRSLLR